MSKKNETGAYSKEVYSKYVKDCIFIKDAPVSYKKWKKYQLSKKGGKMI